MLSVISPPLHFWLSTLIIFPKRMYVAKWVQ